MILNIFPYAYLPSVYLLWLNDDSYLFHICQIYWSVFVVLRFESLLCILGVRPFIEEGNGNPLWYSCLENSTDRGACWLQPMGSQRVRHDWSTNTHTQTFYKYMWFINITFQSVAWFFILFTRYSTRKKFLIFLWFIFFLLWTVCFCCQVWNLFACSRDLGFFHMLLTV